MIYFLNDDLSKMSKMQEQQNKAWLPPYALFHEASVQIPAPV
jgi:hypothetical protein